MKTVRWHALKRNTGHGDDFDYVDTRTFLRAVDAVLPQLKPLFEKYAEEIDWRLLAAIAYQESHWDAQATSPTGVRGMMMLTKNTAQSLGITDRTDAEQSISGGVRYLQDMMSKSAGKCAGERADLVLPSLRTIWAMRICWMPAP